PVRQVSYQPPRGSRAARCHDRAATGESGATQVASRSPRSLRGGQRQILNSTSQPVVLPSPSFAYRPRSSGAVPGGSSGIEKLKLLPFPSSLSTQIRPPCPSTASLQKARPRPGERRLPSPLVGICPNFSKILSNA